MNEYPARARASFEERVDRSGGLFACWPWTGHRHPKKGYGYMASGGRTLGVHRLALVFATGQEIPEGLHVLHHCDNRPCCNPAHLFLGTNAQNVADMVAKGRGATGSRCGRAKLTEDFVARLKRHLLDGTPTRHLAREHNIGRSTVQDIAAGRTWVRVAPAATTYADGPTSVGRPGGGGTASRPHSQGRPTGDGRRLQRGEANGPSRPATT